MSNALQQPKHSPLMHMIVARAKIDAALNAALAAVSEKVEYGTPPSGLSRDVYLALDAAIDDYIMDASRHLQAFQEAAHGA